MLLIGESLNVMSTKIGKALKERDPKPIQDEALFQKEKGMDYIDINLGPAKKEGIEGEWEYLESPDVAVFTRIEN